MKKLISILMAIALCIGMLPVAMADWGDSNQFGIQYNPCDSRATVEVDNTTLGVDNTTLEANSHNNTFTANALIRFLLTPDSTMPDADPFVEIEVYDGNESTPNTLYESRRNDDHKLNLVQNNSNYSFSFTPTSNKFFSVRVYWSDRDRYETFGFNASDEIQLRYRVLGNADVNFTFNDNDRGRVNYHDDRDGYQYCKQNLTKVTTSIGVTLSAREGFEFDKAEFCKYGKEPVSISVTNNQFTWNSDYFDWELNVVFVDPNNPGGNNGGQDGGGQGDGGGGQGGGQGEQGNPQSTNWAALKSEIERYTFAYGPASNNTENEKNMLKKGIAAELYARKMGGPGGSDKSLGMALGYDPEGGDNMVDAEAAIADMIDITGNRHNAGYAGDPVKLPYYEFTVNTGTSEDAPDINAEIEGIQPFTASGKVYVLANAKQFIVKTTVFNDHADPSITYTTLNGPTQEFQNVYFYAGYSDGRPGNDTVEVFGNGAMFNGIDAEDPDVTAGHLTQDHAGSLNTFEMGTRLVVTRVPHTVHIQSTDDAAAWSFTDAGVYNGTGTERNPVNATIFFGSDAITFSTATGGKTVTNVKAVDLPDGAVYFDPGTKVLTFNTNYDEIKVKVTYDDGPTGYILLHRVGLNIDSIQIDKKADVKDENNHRFRSEDKDQCTADTFNVWHGSDQSVRYVSSADKVIVGSFYYDCNYYVEHDNQDGWHVYNGNGSVADNIVAGNSTGFESKQAAVNALHTAVGSVQLLVTITDNNNNVTRKLVSDPLSEAKAVNNGGFNTDVHNAVGYAGQGSNHVYDDFLLWSGSEAEYANIKSVSAIVYNAGNANTFGGVKVGSGTGVQWTNSAK